MVGVSFERFFAVIVFVSFGFFGVYLGVFGEGVG